VVLLWEMSLASWLLALGECGGHNDLRGLGRLSVIPYVHRRTVLYCAQVCLALALSFFNLCEVASTRAFYSSRSDSYIETCGPTGGPEVVKTLYNI
jgi:hypothetical protein